MVSCLSTKLCIFESCTKIQSLKRFDLNSWQTLKQIYSKIQYREDVLESFKFYFTFQKKNGFVFVNQIWHYKALNQCVMAQKIRLPMSGFWQTLKQIYRKLKYRENVFGKSQGLPRFPKKMFLYSLIKLDIFEPCANTQSLLRLDLGCWLALKQVFR